jgi:chromate reductase, NAD(P)H dehydrogenase (quinone)
MSELLITRSEMFSGRSYLFNLSSEKFMNSIVIISGTNRLGSLTLPLARQVAEFYRGLGAQAIIIDLAELPLDVLGPGAYAAKPAGFAPFAKCVLSAAGLVFVVPEYNGGVPGVLKHFIDLLPFPEALQDKPVCFVGLAAGEWGALRPVEQLMQVAIYRKAIVLPRHTLIRDCEDALSIDGSPLSSELDARLREQARQFDRFVSRNASNVVQSASD